MTCNSISVELMKIYILHIAQVVNINNRLH